MAGTIGFDITIMSQYVYYNRLARDRREARAELRKRVVAEGGHESALEALVDTPQLIPKTARHGIHGIIEGPHPYDRTGPREVRGNHYTPLRDA